LLTCTVAVPATLTRSVFAVECRYGSTALLVICSRVDGSNRVSKVGLVQLISSAICFDRPSTTLVEQVEVVYEATDTADDVSPYSSSERPQPASSAAPKHGSAAARQRVCNPAVAETERPANKRRKLLRVFMMVPAVEQGAGRRRRGG